MKLKTVVMVVLGFALLVGAVSAYDLNFIEKNANVLLENGGYTPVDDGAWGKMEYDCDSFNFQGHQLEDGIEYALISYAEPYPGTGSLILGIGIANNGGELHIVQGPFDLDALKYHTYVNPPDPAEYAGQTGAKIWLVPTSDLTISDSTATFKNVWNPSNYLFETELIENGGQCATIPVPEFPSMAVPAALLVGIIGIIAYVGVRKEN
jgi:hypothetical protein